MSRIRDNGPQRVKWHMALEEELLKWLTACKVLDTIFCECDKTDTWSWAYLKVCVSLSCALSLTGS